MFIPVLALAMMQTPSVNDADRGSRLYENCKAGIRFRDAGPSQNLSADAMAANSCIGYIQGFVQAFELTGTKAICTAGASWGTMARVYVAYMDAHPKLMDEHMANDLAMALMDAYPCPVSK